MRTSNSEITYIYTTPIIHSTLLCAKECCLGGAEGMNWIQIQSLILTGCDLRKMSHSLLPTLPGCCVKVCLAH